MSRTARALAIAFAVASAAGCRTTQVTSGEAATTTTPTTPPARPGVIPEGTTLKVRLDQDVGVDASGVGDRFTASVEEPIVAPDGAVVVPEGTVVTGHVSGIKRSERVGDQAAIALDFDTIQFGAKSSDLDADVVATKVRGRAHAKGSRAAVGGGVGATAGALVGAIISGWSGALVGGLVGGGSGSLIGLGTGEAEPRLPEGTELSLRTTAATKVPPIDTASAPAPVITR